MAVVTGREQDAAPSRRHDERSIAIVDAVTCELPQDSEAGPALAGERPSSG
jgi:hypothetical protein